MPSIYLKTIEDTRRDKIKYGLEETKVKIGKIEKKKGRGYFIKNNIYI